jgi:phytoene desaturase
VTPTVEEDVRLHSDVSEPKGEPAINHAQDSSYDVVVIGGGIGGLTGGALLARAGKKVLVVEAEAQPGGFARAIRRGAYTFDRADHLTWGCEETTPFGPGLIDAVLRHLGVRDRCEFVRMDDPMYEARFPGLTLPVPHGRDAYLEAHLKHFPGEAGGLGNLVELSSNIFRELNALPLKATLRDLPFIPRRFPALFRYRNATMKDVIDRELTDPRLKAVYATLWSWIGPPPRQASFLLWAVMMAAYVEDGAYYPRGGFQQLADALAAGLTAAGGELLLGTRASRILAEGRRVRGVELESGQRIEASAVISNISPRETFEKLVGREKVPVRYLRRLRRMELSPSVLAWYAATDLDVRAVGAHHDTMFTTTWDHDRAHANALAGEVPGLLILIPTLKDASLAPRGENLVILQALAPATASGAPRGNSQLADRMLELAEQVLPGLRQRLTFVEDGPSGTESGSPLHVLGPIYGWAASPDQTGMRRLPQETPVAGLVLVGHWTQPGHGIWTVVRSGIGAARLMLGGPTSAPALPLRV